MEYKLKKPYTDFETFIGKIVHCSRYDFEDELSHLKFKIIKSEFFFFFLYLISTQPYLKVLIPKSLIDVMLERVNEQWE